MRTMKLSTVIMSHLNDATIERMRHHEIAETRIAFVKWLVFKYHEQPLDIEIDARAEYKAFMSEETKKPTAKKVTMPPMAIAAKALYELTASPQALLNADEFYVITVENGGFDDKRAKIRLQGHLNQGLIKKITTLGYVLQATNEGWLVAKDIMKEEVHLDITLT